jgi:hypothetical protein
MVHRISGAATLARLASGGVADPEISQGRRSAVAVTTPPLRWFAGAQVLDPQAAGDDGSCTSVTFAPAGSSNSEASGVAE